MTGLVKALLGFVTISVLAAGCLSQPSIWPCHSTADCKGGEKCVLEVGCVQGNSCLTRADCSPEEVCRGSKPCPDGSSCELDEGSLGVCTWVECEDAEPCGAYNCDSSNSCRKSCTSQDHCAPGYACDAVACVPEQCSEYEDPVCEGYLCHDGWCDTECYSTCAPGYLCEDQQCRAEECTDEDETGCNGYGCYQNLCNTTCSLNTHCADGYSCDESSGTCVESGRNLPCESEADCTFSENPVCYEYNGLCGPPCEQWGCLLAQGCDTCGVDGTYFCGADDKCVKKCDGWECGTHQGMNCGSCTGSKVCGSNHQCQNPCGGNYVCGTRDGIACGTCPSGEYCYNNYCFSN